MAELKDQKEKLLSETKEGRTKEKAKLSEQIVSCLFSLQLVRLKKRISISVLVIHGLKTLNCFVNSNRIDNHLYAHYTL